ncbi:N-succinyldiaminopimelate aminotransferase [Inhella inkyongensis]|uniref:N-succinyldiaminopimelate aminotransferase n=1 Tax=Inhella inkyongensis TaxID=392593 RepID=A0A840SAL0_9BURK|nr:succinyldiaminopimelate transaminase [Inhella inkyongensis]MBB5205531.1 N-succinyldiaminopimelate aminotransferase [Inhella inkyongensis]
MNPRLELLQPYPFERLRALQVGIAPNPALRAISLGLGEPRHPAPTVVLEAMRDNLAGLSNYPATAGAPELRAAIAAWIQRRYGLHLDPATQVLPCNGSREALFAIAQTVVDSSRPGATVLVPNPFYQIYEGAALLAGAELAFADSDPARNFAANWGAIPDTVWAKTQLVYVCTPGNPSGAVMPLDEWQRLFELSDRHGFVIAADECYSEIFLGDTPPLGALEAAARLGRSDFRRLISFTSLSKRSSVPGLRSGFVAGDAELIKTFTLYRTYHGSAMSPVVQAASMAAWSDETHVAENRAAYQAKFQAVLPLLQDVLEVSAPDAGFYLWAGVPEQLYGGCDIELTKALLAECNVQVLPGSLLARTNPMTGRNPGQGRVRMALVAEVQACLEAAQRIRQFIESQS